jgi:hypothetical protein
MKKLLKRLVSYLPSKLPVGMTEFNEFADSIIELSGKYADTDSMRFAIASMIIHLGPQKSAVAKNHFVRSLRKSAANQVASQVFQDIKTKQQEAVEAALAEETAKNEKAESDNGKEKKTTN